MNTADSTFTSAWVRDAAARPVAFAQVREDPRIDRQMVERCATEAGSPIAIAQIASGGCTAALLATLPQVAHLHLVDPNPAQLALTRAKLHLLGHHAPTERLAVLGHTTQPAEIRGEAVRRLLAAVGLPEDACGPLAAVAEEGLDHAGRYELLFAALRRHLEPVSGPLGDLLRLGDPDAQRLRAAPGTLLGGALDAAFDDVMALENLVGLFGEGATRHAAMPFSRHFALRLRHALATLPAATNPFVWQLLAGAYPDTNPADWLTLPAPARLPEITWKQATMDAALADASGRFHLVHLSNILDWLPPVEAARTLELAWQALRPGGRVVVRQLNSTLDIPASAPRFAWSTEAEALHAADRSFFYRGLHIGRKP